MSAARATIIPQTLDPRPGTKARTHTCGWSFTCIWSYYGEMRKMLPIYAAVPPPAVCAHRGSSFCSPERGRRNEILDNLNFAVVDWAIFYGFGCIRRERGYGKESMVGHYAYTDCGIPQRPQRIRRGDSRFPLYTLALCAMIFNHWSEMAPTPVRRFSEKWRLRAPSFYLGRRRNPSGARDSSNSPFDLRRFPDITWMSFR